MRNLEIKIEKENRMEAWGQHLIELGFERSQFDNKYKKRVVLWSNNEADYTAKATSDTEGNLILKLTEYAD